MAYITARLQSQPISCESQVKHASVSPSHELELGLSICEPGLSICEPGLSIGLSICEPGLCDLVSVIQEVELCSKGDMFHLSVASRL